jgi:hydrogenase maturation protease
MRVALPPAFRVSGKYNHIMQTLIIAYGNSDRQDDGVAWQVLRELAARLGGQLPSTPLEADQLTLGNVELRYMLQLTPEIADEFDRYDLVVFLDAHTGSVAEDIHVERISNQYQSSPLTHHLSAASLLAIAGVIHGHVPEAVLVTVRGYEFGFVQGLSARAAPLVTPAADVIMKLV